MSVLNQSDMFQFNFRWFSSPTEKSSFPTTAHRNKHRTSHQTPFFVSSHQVLCPSRVFKRHIFGICSSCHLAAPNANTTSFLGALWDQCIIETLHPFLPLFFLSFADLVADRFSPKNRSLGGFPWLIQDEYKTLGEQNVDVKGEVQYTATDFSVGTKHPGPKETVAARKLRRWPLFHDLAVDYGNS